MKEKTSIFFRDPKLPYVESRYVVDSPYHYDKHFHTTLSVGVVENGKVAYVYGNDEYLLEPNQLSIINPNIVHYCNPIKDQSRSYHMIYIDTNWCKELQSVLFQNVKDFIPLNKVQVEDKTLFDQYIKLNQTLLDSKIYYLKKEQMVISFFTKLFTQYCNSDTKEAKKDEKNIDKVERAKLFIESNYQENLTLDEIATHANISKFHLTKLFKKDLNITPHKYLLNCKINKAKELLSKGGNISDVANEVGFFDQSHFNLVFKKYVAATANTYKKVF